MPLVRPRITTKPDFVTMEFQLPSVDPRSFLVEVSGERVYIYGRYAADVRGLPFAIYPQSGSKLKGDFKIPAPVSSDVRYLEASYSDDTLYLRLRRADEYPGRTIQLYVR